MVERFISTGTPVTPRQREATEILIEECAEVIREAVDVQQRATKMLRFGTDEMPPGQLQTNLERLAGEVGDLLAVINLMMKERHLSETLVEEALFRKQERLAKYMQTEKERADGSA